MQAPDAPKDVGDGKAEEPAAPEEIQKRSLLEAVGRSVLEPQNVVLRDKISFVFGVANVAGKWSSIMCKVLAGALGLDRDGCVGS